MVKGIVLISTEAGTEEDVLTELNKYPEVKSAYLVYGIYDVVALIEGESLDDIRSIVFNKIRKIKPVKSTVTMVVVKEVSK
ncbi:MAG: AsnC family transcriptional regulator [Desulfurococcales archaeon ex4484_217_2]|nr:MAG: AsnC family transcriptional regulator [Desulfurococcales archaeon ex4484_217_2]